MAADPPQTGTRSRGPATTATWVEIKYIGGAPRLEDFTVYVTDPLAFTVIYPAEDTRTHLHHDLSLEVGETDVVRFLVDATGVKPGTYVFPLEVSYSRAGEKVADSTKVEVVVR